MTKVRKTIIGILPKDAELVELQECIDLIIDHRGKTPKKLGGDWMEKGIKAISAKNIHDGRLTNFSDIKFVSEYIYQKWMKEDVLRGDSLLVSEGATLGEHLYWDYEFPVVLSQRLFSIRTNKDILNEKYFYAYLTSPYFQNQIAGRASGTSVLGISQAELRKILVALIPMDKQIFIGNLHYSLNKKISLLRRQNEILEEMAQAIFRHWFVDFEFPMSAEQAAAIGKPELEGKPYRSNRGKMVDSGSEFGEVPEGWETGKISDAYKTTSGGTPSRKRDDYYGGEIKWIKSKELNGSYVIDTEEKLTDVGLKNSSAKLLPANTVLVAMYGATVGQIGITHNQMTCNQAICAIIENSQFPFEYVLLSLKNTKAYWTGLSIGSAQQNLSQVIISNLPLLLPIQCNINSFRDVTRPMYNKIGSNIKQIEVMIKIRDTLLPKLMSGEITL